MRPGRRWLVATVAIALTGCSLVLSRVNPGPSPTSPPSVFAADIPLSTTPGTPAVGAGSVWVPNQADGTLARVDPQTNQPAATVKIGDPAKLREKGCGATSVHSVPINSYDIRRCDTPSAVAIAGQAVWVTKNDDAAVAQVDLATNQLGPAIPIGIEAFGLAASPDAVWVSDFQDDAVVHVDLSTRQVVATLRDLAHGPTGIAIGLGGVWVANSRAGVVSRIDPASNTVAAVIPVQERPLSVAIAFGSVWVRNDRGNSVSRIDPTSNTVTATIPVKPKEGRDGVDGLGVDGDGIWVSGFSLTHVNATTNQVDRGLPHDGVSLDYGAGALWVTRLQGDIIRINAP